MSENIINNIKYNTIDLRALKNKLSPSDYKETLEKIYNNTTENIETLDLTQIETSDSLNTNSDSIKQEIDDNQGGFIIYENGQEIEHHYHDGVISYSNESGLYKIEYPDGRIENYENGVKVISSINDNTVISIYKP